MHLGGERKSPDMLGLGREELVEHFERARPVAETPQQAGAFVEELGTILGSSEGKPCGDQLFERFGVFALGEQVVESSKRDLAGRVRLERASKRVLGLLVLLEAIQTHRARLFQQVGPEGSVDEAGHPFAGLGD